MFIFASILSSVTRLYIHSTVAAYFQDPDLCAEQLMGLPIKHDQFLYLLVEEIFSTCLAPPYSPLATMGYTRLAAVFMTQLLHRLCILERSVIPVSSVFCECVVVTTVCVPDHHPGFWQFVGDCGLLGRVDVPSNGSFHCSLGLD